MKQINAMGDACPLPVIKVKKALSEMDSGSLEVMVDNDTAVRNIEKFARSEGCDFSVEGKDGEYRILIEKSEGAAPVGKALNIGKTVVVLSSDMMGSGDDGLGRSLMKGFIFALTQLNELPDSILLYNGGAKLSAGESASIDDLKALEAAGVKIMTCGACLNHFELTDKLGVGEVTNMYSIVEEMRSADRIIRP